MPRPQAFVYRRRDLFRGGRIKLLVDPKRRRFFSAICRQLSRGTSAQRLRHIRRTEKAITLNHLRLIAHRIDREVGIFYDTKMPISGGRYTPICLYAGNKKSGSATAGASIQFPPGGSDRYKIIAHYHSTTSASKTQVRLDIRHASEDVEMVVNANGLIVYYNDDGCLNKCDGSRLLAELKDPDLDQFRLSLTTPITPITLMLFLNQLSAAVKPPQPTSPSPSVGSCLLFAGCDSDDDDEPALEAEPATA